MKFTVTEVANRVFWKKVPYRGGYRGLSPLPVQLPKTTRIDFQSSSCAFLKVVLK